MSDSDLLLDRRSFVQIASAAALAAVLPAGAQAAPRRRPNVLYIFSDQHRAASLPGEPYDQATAPNLAAFRQANFSMDRCVSNYPLCTPYRGILMSGRWPVQTGLVHNNIKLQPSEHALGRVFKEAGYHTAYVGKWHLQGPGDGFIPAGPDRQGFDDWHVWERTDDHYTSWTYDPDTGARIQPPGWNCNSMTDQAVALLQRAPASQPWLMVVSWNPPHPPYNPPEADAAHYPPQSLRLRPNVTYPLQGRKVGHSDMAQALSGPDGLRRAMQGYYGAITGVDLEFARLMRTLDETGQAADTIVVYTSDHGEMMGSQGRMQKQVPFEESCRVPFFVRYPGVTVPGGRSQTLFAAVDIYPTLCGLAGVAVPSHCVGRDLSSVMRGGSVQPSSAVFLMNQRAAHAPDLVSLAEEDAGGEDTQHPQGDDMEDAGRDGAQHGRHRRGGPAREFVDMESYRGLRTDTHTYAVAQSGRWCLYDNVADPFQMKNLVTDPAQAELMARFDAEITAWLAQTGDPFPFAEAVQRVSSYPT